MGSPVGDVPPVNGVTFLLSSSITTPGFDSMLPGETEDVPRASPDDFSLIYL
jgi:hypothetical protein